MKDSLRICKAVPIARKQHAVLISQFTDVNVRARLKVVDRSAEVLRPEYDVSISTAFASASSGLRSASPFESSLVDRE